MHTLSRLHPARRPARFTPARFWTWWSAGPVRLTMQPGDIITLHRRDRTDEGWDTVTERYQFDGTAVRCDLIADGTDCDGRLSAHGAYAATLAQLRARKVDGIGYPDWSLLDRSQRDYTAEAAGY